MLFLRYEVESKSDPHSLDLELDLELRDSTSIFHLTKADIKVIISTDGIRTTGPYRDPALIRNGKLMRIPELFPFFPSFLFKKHYMDFSASKKKSI